MTFNCWFTQLYSRYSKYVYIYTHTHTHTHTDCGLRQKHLTFFEIWKPASQRCTVFVPTVIMYSDVWSSVEMERWSVQHWIAAVELFIKTNSVTATQRGVRQNFQRRDSPGRNPLLLRVSKWRQEGPVKDSKAQERPFSAPAPDSVERERDATLRNPPRSARRQVLALRLNEWSLCRILHKDLPYRPYKIQVAQEGEPTAFLRWILGLCEKQ